MKTGGGGADVLEKIVHMEPNLKTIVFGRKSKMDKKANTKGGGGRKVKSKNHHAITSM